MVGAQGEGGEERGGRKREGGREGKRGGREREGR